MWWLGFAICPNTNNAWSNYSLNGVNCIAFGNFCCDLRSVSTLPSCIIYLLLLFTYHPNIQSQLFTLLLRHYFYILCMGIHTHFICCSCISTSWKRVKCMSCYGSSSPHFEFLSSNNNHIYICIYTYITIYIYLISATIANGSSMIAVTLSKQWILINQRFLRSIWQVRIEITVFDNWIVNWPIFLTYSAVSVCFSCFQACPCCRFSFKWSN